MTVIVTGATGFLGGRYALHALARGESVVAIGRNPAKLAKLARAGARIVYADLAQGLTRAELDKTLGTHLTEDVSCIVHSAALSSPFGSYDAFKAANVDGTRTICHLLVNMPGVRLINISSPAIYAAPRDQLLVYEEDPLPKPINAYAATKREAELIVARTIGRRAITLRPRGIYGNGDNALLPRLMKTAARGPLPLLRDGSAMTDITHVKDVISAIDAARAAPTSALGKAYNISGGVDLRITDIIEAAAERQGLSIRWKKLPVSLAMMAARLMEAKAALGGWRTEPRATPYSVGILAYSQTLNITLARRMLNWDPEVSFEEGLAEAFSGRDPWAVQK